MKKNYLYLLLLVLLTQLTSAQNVGIGTTTPASKLHIKGAVNVSQLIIEAHSTQSNTNPLIKLRKSDGSDLMWIHSDDINNSFIGVVAGGNNNAAGGGIFNTFCGSFTGGGNTTGSSNTTLGAYAFANNKTGSYNTAIGTYSLYQNLGSSNTAIGMNALASNGIGNYNSAIGHEALYSNNTGGANTANGYRALYSNTTASFNTATGYFALYSNTIGYQNIANGEAALYSNKTASENVAIGGNALALQSFSNGGVAWASGNVAIGEHALYSNQPTSTSNGVYNTAIGHSALSGNITGAYNTATGYDVLTQNASGSFNTASGYKALSSNTTGVSNTAVGIEALKSNISGFANTAIGVDALVNNTGGSENIAIGGASGTHPNAPNIYNTVGIGNNDILNGFQDQVIIGNTRTWFIGGKVNWGTVSDARIKNTIVEDVKGLDFILRLRPVTYHISNKALITLTRNKETPDYPGKNDNEKIKYSGFIAQEVEQAAKAAAYEFSGYDAPKNEWGLYTLKYAEFVVPLVKAVQEQQIIIEEQNKKIELLMKEIQQIKDKLK